MLISQRFVKVARRASQRCRAHDACKSIIRDLLSVVSGDLKKSRTSYSNLLSYITQSLTFGAYSAKYVELFLKKKVVHLSVLFIFSNCIFCSMLNIVFRKPLWVR